MSAANKRVRRIGRGLRVFRYLCLIVLLLGTAALGVGYARADSNAAAFAAAGACSGSGRSGCAGQIPVALEDAGLVSGRSTSYWLEVAGDSVPDQRVYLSCGGNDKPFFMAAQGKGNLTATMWQGRVASLTYSPNGLNSTRCNSRDSPALVAQYWLIGLGIVGSLLLGWLAVIAQTRIADPRRKQLAQLAIAPVYLNALVFPIVIGVAGSHALWLYLPAYAICAAVELPLFGLARHQRRRREARQLTDQHPGTPRTLTTRTPRSGSTGRSGTTRSATGKGVARKIGFVFFGILVAGALTLLAFYIPSQADAFAYENAPGCSGSVTSGCVQEVTATVVDTGSYTSNSSSDTYWIEIRGPGIPDQQFTLGGDDPAGLADEAQSAGTVSAVLWKGRVVEVAEGGTTSPGPTTPLKTAVGLLSGLYAVVSAIVFWLLVIAAVRARSSLRRHLLGALGTVLLAGGIFAFAPLLVEVKPVLWAYPLTCAVAAVFVLPMYWLVLVVSRRAQRKRAQRLRAS